MKIERYISKRYFSVKKGNSFTSLISVISIAGIVLGVAALVIVLSVMNGFEREVRERILGITGHLTIRKYGDMPIYGYDSLIAELRENHSEIKSASPMIIANSGISYRDRQEGIMVRGVVPRYEKETGNWAQYVTEGNFAFADTFSNLGNMLPGIIPGKHMADRLGAEMGDEVVLVSFSRNMNLFKNPMPRVRKFVIRGMFETGMYEYDASIAFIGLNEAQRLFQYDRGTVSTIQFIVDDYNRAGELAINISNELSYPFFAVDWMTQHRTIFRWMKIERWLMFVTLSLIIIVAAFNIISSLVMLVMEKTRDIGILRAIGLSKKQIWKIFILDGLYVGLMGSFLGTVLGLALSYGQQRFEWFSLPGDVYFINKLPIHINPFDVVLVNLTALFICFLASFYPAKRASELDSVEAIHYE